ncbi:helix-turn-helix domain-containing protein [Geopseudomonas aromaticivorans]
MSIDIKAVGKRVAYVRKIRGMTQHELAAKAKVAQSTLATLEAGRVETSRKLVNIAMAMDVPSEWLLKGDDSSIVIQDILFPRPTWDASEAEKSTNRLLRQMRFGEDVELTNNTAPATTPPPQELPVISWLSTHLAKPQEFSRQDWELPKPVLCPFEHSAQAFYMRVPSDLMFPAFQEDDLILVEPGLEATHGRNVVVLHADGQTALGRLESFGKRWALIAMSAPPHERTVFPLTHACKIIGVITARLNRQH